MSKQNKPKLQQKEQNCTEIDAPENVCFVTLAVRGKLEGVHVKGKSPNPLFIYHLSQEATTERKNQLV